jgi:hypothetical protein
MGKIFAIFCGSVMMFGGVWLAIFVWRQEFLELVFGSVPPLLFLVGLIAFIAGLSSIKDAQRIKKLQEETPTEESEPVNPEESEQETKEI